MDASPILMDGPSRFWWNNCLPEQSVAQVPIKKLNRQRNLLLLKQITLRAAKIAAAGLFKNLLPNLYSLPKNF